MESIRSYCRVVLTLAASFLLMPAASYAQFVYVANESSGNISGYSINPTTGALTPILGSPFSAGEDPVSVAVDPTGKFAYVLNYVGCPCSIFLGDVSGYTIDSSTGALTPIPGSPFPAGAEPMSVAVDPSGSSAYVVNYEDSNISGYTIDYMTGALTPLLDSPFPEAIGSLPTFIAMDPSGKFAYVTNINPPNANISAYTIETGGLLPIPGPPFPALPSYSMAVDPSGKFAYVPNFSGFILVPGSVQGYTIDSTSGALTPISGSPVPTGPNPTSIAIDPSGKFVYVANDDYPLPGNVLGYTINSSTGALTPIPGSPFTAGAEPVSVAVDPSGRFVYVANNLSNNVSGYTIDPTNGVLTPICGSPFPAGVAPRSVAITGCARPPTITDVSASPSTLWPPNHELIDVLVNYDVTAPCGEPAVCTLSVASNEPVNDDQTSPDWVVLDDHHVELRAERSGNGSGRIYTVTVRCKDARGNSATQNTSVTVAHDQGH